MRNRVFIYALFVIMIWPLFAAAPEYSEATALTQNVEGRDSLNARVWNRPTRLPKLNNHRFFASNSVSDPFIATRVTISTGAGLVGDLTFKINDPNTGEEIVGLRGDIAFISSRIRYQQALSDRFSLQLKTNILTRLAVHEDMDLGLEIASSRLDQSGVTDTFTASIASFHLNYFF